MEKVTVENITTYDRVLNCLTSKYAIVSLRSQHDGPLYYDDDAHTLIYDVQKVQNSLVTETRSS